MNCSYCQVNVCFRLRLLTLCKPDYFETYYGMRIFLAYEKASAIIDGAASEPKANGGGSRSNR